jgi:hypothetical protein
MGWPAKFDEPTKEALVLVPAPAAMVQDLGRFRSGFRMETDILPRSALICASRNGEPLVGEDGCVTFAFEGDAHGADNLKLFHERCMCAAGRLATRYPSMSYGRARLEDLHPVARYSLVNYTFLEILDAPSLEAWSEEPVNTYLPPRDLQTPTDDPAIVTPLCNLPSRPMPQGRSVIGFLLADGTILTKDMAEDTPLKAWRPKDDGLDAILEKVGLDAEERRWFRGLDGEDASDTFGPSSG